MEITEKGMRCLGPYTEDTIKPFGETGLHLTDKRLYGLR